MTIIADDRVAELDRANAELRAQLAACRAELAEVREQQTATAEVLGVINSSPGDLAPVFDAMLEKAMRLCGAAFGVFAIYDEEHYRVVANHGVPLGLAEFVRQAVPIHSGSMPDRLRCGEDTIQVADITALGSELRTPGLVAMIELGNARTAVWVALRKDCIAQGFFGVYRQEVRPFTDKQIALLQNFAAQAVIAMENARLITETSEALEQQTATAEVLQVINSSPGDLTPVFDAMLDKAMRLCEAAFGGLWTFDQDRYVAVALRNVSTAYAAFLAKTTVIPGPGTAPHRFLQGERLAHNIDLASEEPYKAGDPQRRVLVDLGGARTALQVPLRKDDHVLGVITIYRQEVRPFSDKQIALLQNFAAQAVIAMENARLITETSEALEQQTATAEVLQVINSSPGDVAPVFDAMLEKATRLCEAEYGLLATYDGDKFHGVAAVGFPTEIAEGLSRLGHPPPGTVLGRLERTKETVQMADISAEPSYAEVFAVNPILRGVRTNLAVPMLKEGELVGAFNVFRQEVRPFGDKQIALLQNFAAQAVIAMENARLITETREALEQQTATAEVLQVINSSPGDLEPVFEAILDKARAVCGFAHGSLNVYDGEFFRTVAMHGYPEGFAEVLRQPRRTGPQARFLEGDRIVHITDVAAERPAVDDPVYRAAIEAGVRTVLFVPLRNDQRLFGYITANRREVRPFSDKQIALLQNFAAQAIIAMENARLLTETREALEQQTATAEVLQVINSSPGDLAPVFDAILEKAHTLCDAEKGSLNAYDGEHFHAVATHGLSPEYAAMLRAPQSKPPGSPPDRLLRGEPIVQVPDASVLPFPIAQAATAMESVRTILYVPLRKDTALLGYITVYRQEVRPFSDKQIALLQNFAAQAVIAMENARLLTETREALEQQTATAEVLQVINSSPGDLTPVFDAILDKAQRVCGVDHAALELYDGGRMRAVAVHGASDKFAETLRRGYRAIDSPAARALLAGDRIAQITDAAQIDHIAFRTAAEVDGVRTVLFVPLRREDALLGMIASARREVRPFSEKEIALLENFATQAVIAMENVRLITELRQRTHDLQESLEYQTATSDVLKVISQSTFDLEPVLQTVLDTAMRLCGNSQGEIFRLEDGVYRMAVGYGMEPGYRDIEAKLVITPGPNTLVGRTALAGRPVQIVDALADPDYEPKDDARVGKLRSMLGVPLLREGVPIGVICTARTTVEPFTEKQIALVSTFADQAVIAIENARLFNELHARTTELGSSVAELKMLNEVAQAVSSTLDLRTVLSTVLNASLGVTWANAGAVFRYSRAERAFRLVEAVGWDEALTRSVRELRIAESESAMGEAVAGREPVQLPDLAQRASYPLRDITLAAGFHSALIVPLAGAERILGAIILMRQEAGEFPPETVRLMQTLASQSVLAIQNARLFREIADKSEQLALASQHKSQFLANMSHELRTPLNAILGYAELLVDGIYGVLPDRPKGVLERIQNNGKHLLALINDVLDLAKIEAGQLTLTLEDYSLPEVVQSVVTATEPLATSKGLKFTAVLQDDLPMAHGDARRVAQVLLNLVGNAIKFTDEGEVEIRAMLDKGQFLMTVRDTGPGIADADQERIFGEFQQIDNTNTRKKGGTGLGLAISKRMVEIQGGTISVDSAWRKGSTFRVVLPVHVDEMMEAAE